MYRITFDFTDLASSHVITGSASLSIPLRCSNVQVAAYESKLPPPSNQAGARSGNPSRRPSLKVHRKPSKRLSKSHCLPRAPCPNFAASHLQAKSSSVMEQSPKFRVRCVRHAAETCRKPPRQTPAPPRCPCGRPETSQGCRGDPPRPPRRQPPHHSP